VAASADANRLRIEPLNGVARLGEKGRFHVLTTQSASVGCKTADGETLYGEGDAVVVPSPSVAVPVEVVCQAGDATARAQITFTDSKTLPVANPYAGGVVLFKLRELEKQWTEPVARTSVGAESFDDKLKLLGADVLPAFPFDRSGARDSVGLGLWIVVDLPEGVNFYQAVSWLRSDPAVFPESYLPEDGAFLRVHAAANWPAPLHPSTRVFDADAEAYRNEVRLTTQKRAQPTEASPDLQAIGAPQVWGEEQGVGVRIAVIDTGIDIDHASLRPNLVDKRAERDGSDMDQNGVPGDEFGVNLAQLAIARGDNGETRLGLGLVNNVSDWDGATDKTRRVWGHGTTVASIAVGASEGGGRIGVAPRAQVLAVDVQENLRTSLSQRSGDDPRMHNSEAPPQSLRGDSVWARAAGITYAVGERARVMTCAWPGQRAHLILHDALLFAEDNCALAVCGPGDEPGKSGDYPSHWRASWLGKHGGENGVVYDPWTGEELDSVLLRPLRGTIVADVRASLGSDSDLVLPERGGQRLALDGAISNPLNDGSTIPDRRIADVPGSAGAVGLTAGAAALVSGGRPDLEPWALTQAMIAGANRPPAGGSVLFVPGAMAATAHLPEGSCRSMLRNPSKQAGPNPKFKIKIGDEAKPGRNDLPPASPDRTTR
jgi:hypothetical protein